MKIKTLYILFAMPLLWMSCSKDFGTTEVTYNKAIAIYADLNDIRDTPLIEGVRQISDPGKVFVSDEFLLIGEEGLGIHVLDNSDPTSPNPISFLNVPGNKEFFVADGFVYAESYYDMVKIDIHNINAPKITGRVENYFESNQLNNGQGEAVIGFRYEIVTEEIRDDDQNIWNSIYNYDEVLYDYNRSVIPHSAVPASFAGSSNKAIGSVNRITKAKDHIYAVNNERISIISDQNLQLVSSYFITVGMETIYPQSDYLFIGGTNSVEILSIENPSTPFHAGSFWHPTSCDPVYPLQEVAYLTLRTGDEDCPGDVNSLLTLDIRDISAASVVQQIEMESPFGVTLINDKLYVGEGEYGLKIFDATDRYNLKLLKYDSSLPAYDIIQHPSRSDIVLIAGPHGFGQYDVNVEDEFSLISWIAY